jgi:hypothetical protein
VCELFVWVSEKEGERIEVGMTMQPEKQSGEEEAGKTVHLPLPLYLSLTRNNIR